MIVDIVSNRQHHGNECDRPTDSQTSDRRQPYASVSPPNTAEQSPLANDSATLTAIEPVQPVLANGVGR
jgi:hypothetical protein